MLNLRMTLRMTDLQVKVEAVLWDADGVLQHGRRTWVDRLTEVGGPGFAEALFEAEKGPLRGSEPFRDCIARLLVERDLEHSPDDILTLWEDLDLDQDAFALIASVRAAGTPCYLATNQQDHRVRYMRDALGYDAHFDGVYYSSEVGAMKPEAAYFEHVLDDLGLAPEVVVFIDDSVRNVDAALARGIRALHHDPSDGVAGLRRLLAGAGVGP